MALNWCESVILKAAARAVSKPPNASSTTATVPAGSIQIFDQPDRNTPPRDGANSLLVRRDSTDLAAAPTTSRSSAAPRDDPVPVLEVDTVLRQWMGMRPEQPPLEVRPWLLLGGAHHACDLPLLRRLGIGYVMNVAWNVRNFHEDQPGLRYKNLRVKDYGYDAGISRIFEEAAAFGRQVRQRYEGVSSRDKGPVTPNTEEAFKPGSRLLVHCRYGLNRSPTVVVAMLMQVRVGGGYTTPARSPGSAPSRRRQHPCSLFSYPRTTPCLTPVAPPCHARTRQSRSRACPATVCLAPRPRKRGPTPVRPWSHARAPVP